MRCHQTARCQRLDAEYGACSGPPRPRRRRQRRSGNRATGCLAADGIAGRRIGLVDRVTFSILARRWRRVRHTDRGALRERLDDVGIHPESSRSRSGQPPRRRCRSDDRSRRGSRSGDSRTIGVVHLSRQRQRRCRWRKTMSSSARSFGESRGIARVATWRSEARWGNCRAARLCASNGRREVRGHNGGDGRPRQPPRHRPTSTGVIAIAWVSTMSRPAAIRRPSTRSWSRPSAARATDASGPFTAAFPAATIRDSGEFGPDPTPSRSVPRYARRLRTNLNWAPRCTIRATYRHLETTTLGKRVPAMLDELIRRRLVRRRAADPDLI